MEVDQEELAFDAAVGRTILAWANVEMMLANIYSHCFPEGEGAGLAGIGFFSIENFRSKLSAVDNVFRRKFVAEQKRVDDWTALHDLVRTLSNQRNEVAHRQKIGFISSTPGRRFALLEHLSDKIHPESPGQPPPGAMCLKEIEQRGLRFAMAGNRLLSFLFQLRGGEPFEESYLQERRPMGLADKVHQMHAMLGPPPKSLVPKLWPQFRLVDWPPSEERLRSWCEAFLSKSESTVEQEGSRDIRNAQEPT